MLSNILVKTSIIVIIVYLVSFILPLFWGKKKIQLIVLLIGVVGIAFQLLVNRDENFSQLGFRFSTIDTYIWGFLTVSGILVVVLCIGYLTGRLGVREKLDIRGYVKLSVNIPLQIIVNTVIAIFTEELVFRGLIQRQLTLVISPVVAILLASAVFGIWHIPFGKFALNLNKKQIFLYVLGTGLAGGIFGIFYYKTGSLLVSGFVHGLWNGIVYPIWGLGDGFSGLLQSKRKSLTHPEYGIIGIIVLSLVFTILLLGTVTQINDLGFEFLRNSSRVFLI